MTKRELDSLTVYQSKDGKGVELWNSSGRVRKFRDRDAAYAEIRRLRSKGASDTRRGKLKRR